MSTHTLTAEETEVLTCKRCNGTWTADLGLAFCPVCRITTGGEELELSGERSSAPGPRTGPSLSGGAGEQTSHVPLKSRDPLLFF